MNTISSIQLTDGTWLHAFGVINGLFLSTILYMLFFSVSALHKKSQNYISRTFFFLAVTAGLFTCYSIYFQYSNLIISHIHYPAWLITIAKFSAPLALIITTEIFLRNVALKSYDGFLLVKRLKPLRYISLAINLATCVLLIFIDDAPIVLVVLQIMFLPSIIAGMIINYFSTQHRFKYNLINITLLSSVLICGMYSLYILYVSSVLPQIWVLLIITCYSIIMMLLAFSIIRYGFDEVKRYNDIRQIDKDQLTDRLYTAIENQEFYLMFQPIVSLASQSVTGLEALLRWKHPKHGVISPKVFIPLAERINMLNHLCLWTIEQTIIHAKSLLKAGYRLPIAINFSASNMHPDNINFLIDCLEKYDVPTNMITIEITESLLIDHSAKQISALHMLQALDITISLDDYGTGFSSLNHIRSLHVKQLKIDKSFITNLDTNHDNMVIVKSTLQMGKGLKLNVIAEGVESHTVINHLTQLGCDEIQGYVISPPLEIGQLYQWLKSDAYKRAFLNVTASV